MYWLDYGKKIYIRCDASKMGCGAQLFQIGEDSFERTVSFISKTFTKTEQNWSTLEQGLFAAVWSVKTWKSWLEGAHFHIHLNRPQKHLATTKERCSESCKMETGNAAVRLYNHTRGRSWGQAC